MGVDWYIYYKNKHIPPNPVELPKHGRNVNKKGAWYGYEKNVLDEHACIKCGKFMMVSEKQTHKYLCGVCRWLE